MWYLVEEQARSEAQNVVRSSVQAIWPQLDQDNVLEALVSAVMDVGQQDAACYSSMPLHALREWARYAGVMGTDMWVHEALAVLWQLSIDKVRETQLFIDLCVSSALTRLFESGKVSSPTTAKAGFDSPQALLIQWFSDATEAPPQVSEYFISYLYKETLWDKLKRYSDVTEDEGVMGRYVRNGMNEIKASAVF